MEIAALVAKAAESKSTVSADFGCVKYGAPNISDWPDPRSGKETREFFEKLFEVSNQHFLFLGRERFSIVAVLVESSAPDQVLEALAKKAKEAADQCSPHNIDVSDNGRVGDYFDLASHPNNGPVLPAATDRYNFETTPSLTGEVARSLQDNLGVYSPISTR